MRCDDFDELIYLFWDGRLDESQKEKLQKHLSTCERCNRKLVLLESIEKGGRGIRPKEPSPEYWDTFSSRVREKIVARKEGSLSVRLKKAFENLFTFTPGKIKIAAGVVSAVLVFMVGKIYLDYRGKEIVPTAPRMERAKKPALHAPEPKKEAAPGVQKVGEGEEAIPPAAESEKGGAPETAPGKITTPAATSMEKARQKEGVIPRTDESKRAIAPQIVSEKRTATGTVESEEEALLPEDYTSGAGAEDKPKVMEEATPPEQEVKDVEEIRLKGVTKAAAKKTTPLALDRTVKPTFVKTYFVIEGKEVPRIGEEDTLVQEDVLRKTIESWSTYIEKNPKDSLANEGYLQVAIGYYLLTRLTQEESDLAKGTEVLEKYEKQATDPKIKEELNNKVKQLKALKEK